MNNKKDIYLYVIHPVVKDVDKVTRLFCLDELRVDFNFILDKKQPKYVIVSEHIYYKKQYMQELMEFIEKGAITIFFAGECITPDMNIFDYAVCWDRDLCMSDRTVRIPPMNSFFKNFALDDRTEINYEQALELLKRKNKFCNFIYSNPDAHFMRDMIYRRLSKYKRVDSLGKHLNNVGIPGTGFANHFRESTLLKDDYKFSIASENACFDGYTSEKIFTSFQAHTVPIYWGNPNVSELFNEKAFINVNKYNSLDELVDEVKRIDNSDEIWCKMVSEPWQTEEQKLRDKDRMKEYICFWTNIFSQKFENARRIPVGYHPDRYKKWFFESHFMKKIEWDDRFRILKNRIMRFRK